MKILAAIVALLYSAPVTPEQEYIGWQPWMLGAPCSLKSDYVNGRCYVPEVKRKPKWE